MKNANVSSIDLETTTLADVAELFGERIADALRKTVRQIVREELAEVREAGDS